MTVNTNAESIYFAKDDEQKFYGVNKSGGKNILILIEEEEIVKIKFYEQVTGKFHSISNVNPYDFKFDNFKWNEKNRPNSVNDLIVWTKKAAEK